jgi:hypothetical protein
MTIAVTTLTERSDAIKARPTKPARLAAAIIKTMDPER